MRLCSCGHPIVVLQGEEPEPEQCFCCRHGVKVVDGRAKLDAREVAWAESRAHGRADKAD